MAQKLAPVHTQLYSLIALHPNSSSHCSKILTPQIMASILFSDLFLTPQSLHDCMSSHTFSCHPLYLDQRLQHPLALYPHLLSRLLGPSIWVSHQHLSPTVPKPTISFRPLTINSAPYSWPPGSQGISLSPPSRTHSAWQHGRDRWGSNTPLRTLLVATDRKFLFKLPWSITDFFLVELVWLHS